MNPNNALATVSRNTELLDHQQEMEQQLAVRFKDDLNQEQARQLAQIAIAYDLDPFMGHLIPYEGQPYVTLDGYLRIADRQDAYDGFDHRPATEDERRGLQAHDDEVIWVAEVHRKDRSRPTRAYGRAGGPGERNPLVSGRNKKSSVFISPMDQALVRALRKALRMSFSLNLPFSADDDRVTNEQLRALHAVDAEAGVDREQRHHELQETYGVESSDQLTRDQASAYIDGRRVDTATGEILDVDEESEEIEVDPDVFDDDEPPVRPVSAAGVQMLQELARARAFVGVDLADELDRRYGVRQLESLTSDQAREFASWLKSLQK